MSFISNRSNWSMHSNTHTYLSWKNFEGPNFLSDIFFYVQYIPIFV